MTQEENIEKETNKISKVQTEEQPNITFGINGEIVSSIFGFLTGINCDIPMKFEKDRIFIHLKAPDNVQYAQVEINSSGLLDYNPRLEYGNTEKNIVVDTRRIGLECIDKIINIVKTNIVVDDGFVKVFIFEDKIEFHLPGNIIVWAKLIKGKEMENTMKGVERLPALIKKTRSDPNIKKASVTIEQYWFDRICSIREVERCERAFKISIDKKEGLTLFSKGLDDFYELILKPKYLQIESDSDSSISVCIDKDYILPFNILGRCGNVSIGYTPVRFEIMQNKPIILEKKLTPGVRTMLTIAPRLKTEEKEGEEKKIKVMDVNKMRELSMDF